jgi:hypothetical protein
VRRIFLAACLLGGRAYADHASLHATAIGDVAATDNVNAVAGDNNPQSDLYTELRPGVLFAFEGPRMIHNLSAELDLLEYAANAGQPAVNVRGGWQGFFLPGPRSEIVLTANGGTGYTNALAGLSSPDTSMMGVVPAGSAEMRNLDASEYLSWQSTKETRTSQTAFVRWTATNDDQPMPTTTAAFETGGVLGFERSFHHDTVGIEAGGSYLRLERVAPAGALLPSRLDQQINPRASAVWRHDLSKLWSLDLNGGLVYVNPVGTDPYSMGAPPDRRAQPFPIFGGVLAYTDVWGRATLSANRSVTPDLFLAQNTVDDQVTLRLALPLPWLDEYPHMRNPKLVGLGSLGVERTQLVDPITTNLLGTFDLARIDVGVGWTPRPGQTYGLRYEFVYQHGDSAAAMVTPSYHRDTLFFTFALRWPEDVAVKVPRRTESVRSDRKDLSPVGAEPVVPDAAEPDAGE